MASSASDLYDSAFSKAKRSFEGEDRKGTSPISGFAGVSSDEGSRAFGEAAKGNALTFATGADSAPRGAAAVAGGLANERSATNQAMIRAVSDSFAAMNQPRGGGDSGGGLLGTGLSIAGSFINPFLGAAAGAAAKGFGWKA